MEFVSNEFLENIQKMKILVLNFEAFFRPSALKTEIFSKRFKGRLCVYKGNVDTIFNMAYGSRISPIAERVNISLRQLFCFILSLTQWIKLYD